MKIITRYMSIDLLIYIAEGAVLFTFVFLLKNLYELTDLFVAGGSTLSATFQLFFSLLPSIMIISFPMAVLLSSLLLYGRMTQDNELTALQASGYSALQLLVPAILIGLVLTGLLYWWANRIAPKGLRTFQMLAVNILQKSATTGIRAGEFNHLGNFVFNPRSVKADKMHDLNLFEQRGGTVSGVISAPTASIFFVPETQSLRLQMDEGVLHQMPQPDRDVVIQFDKMDFTIGIPRLLRRVAKISTTEQRLSNKILIRDSNQLFQDYMNSPNKDDPEIKYFLEESRVYQIELARRSALPFACLFMMIIGALLGLESRYGKRSACYTMTIIVILVYYILLSFGKTLSEDGTLPAIAGMWIPNAVSILFAMYLYYRTQKI